MVTFGERDVHLFNHAFYYMILSSEISAHLDYDKSDIFTCEIISYHFTSDSNQLIVSLYLFGDYP